MNRPAEFADIPAALSLTYNRTKGSSKIQGTAGSRHRRRARVPLSPLRCWRKRASRPKSLRRQQTLNWVGLHARLHHLGLISKILYSNGGMLAQLVSVGLFPCPTYSVVCLGEFRIVLPTERSARRALVGYDLGLQECRSLSDGGWSPPAVAGRQASPSA